MWNLLKQIFRTGVVTEGLDKYDCFQSDYKKINTPAHAQLCSECSVCIESCPSQALAKDEQGIVVLDYKRCAFCSRCLDACPQRVLNKGVGAVPLVVGAEVLPVDWQKLPSYRGRSLHVRHLDAGSCNACDFEMSALLNPIYDIQRYGVDFVASPRHADIVMVTGMVTRNLRQAVLETYAAMPQPSLVMAVGSCACSGTMFGEQNYAQMGAVSEVLPVDIYVPGCPPTPQMMVYALLYAQELLAQKLKNF